jgi:TMEM199 family protein
MVLLTMTDAIVKALGNLGIQSCPVESGEDAATKEVQGTAQEPSLSSPAIGKPISHGQVMDISRQLKSRGHSSYHLDILLRGSRVYAPPLPPKPEPVSLTQEGLVYSSLAAC